jgi:hypothetical protein
MQQSRAGRKKWQKSSLKRCPTFNDFFSKRFFDSLSDLTNFYKCTEIIKILIKNGKRSVMYVHMYILRYVYVRVYVRLYVQILTVLVSDEKRL